MKVYYLAIPFTKNNLWEMPTDVEGIYIYI